MPFMDKRLAFLLKNSNDILCVTDMDANIISANSSWEHFTCLNSKETKNKNMLSLTHPADRIKFSEAFTSISSLKNIEGISARISTPASDILTISWSICFDEGKDLIYAVGIYCNENLNIRNPYHISDKVQHVLANLTEGFFMLDANWRVNAFNHAFQKMTRLTGDELYGADFRMLDGL